MTSETDARAESGVPPEASRFQGNGTLPTFCITSVRIFKQAVSLGFNKMLGEQMMKPIMVDGGKSTVELAAEGVLRIVWKPGTVLEAPDVQGAMAKVNELADGVEYPMLIDIANTQAVTRQARSVFSVKCAASRIALLGSSPLDRVIANFAMARRTLPCPTRYFTSRDEAMAWLLGTRLS